MAAQRVTIALDEEVLAELLQLVGREGLSAYLNEAARRQLDIERLGELLDELDAEYGPVDPEIMEQVRRQWPRPGDSQHPQSMSA